jgi:hypothetical protein
MEQLELFNNNQTENNPCCPVCKTNFQKKRYNHKYCSKKCYLLINKEYKIKYRLNNKEKINEIERNYCAKNKDRKIYNNYRSNIRGYIFGRIKHSKSVIELLGCDREEYKKYLESKFKEGMTWENRGRNGWHIDHILPRVHFKLENIEEQKRFFHYTNTQPLWAYENLSKGTKILQ